MALSSDDASSAISLSDTMHEFILSSSGFATIRLSRSPASISHSSDISERYDFVRLATYKTLEISINSRGVSTPPCSARFTLGLTSFTDRLTGILPSFKSVDALSVVSRCAARAFSISENGSSLYILFFTDSDSVYSCIRSRILSNSSIFKTFFIKSPFNVQKAYLKFSSKSPKFSV